MEDKLQKREETQPETVQDRRWVAPRVDIYENEEEILLLADLPGVDSESLQINLDKEELILQASAADPPQGTALRTEFVPVDYRRTFIMPGGVDAEKIAADLKQGVLWLHLPKSAALKPRQIEVKAG